jgi:hypothetical protein
MQHRYGIAHCRLVIGQAYLAEHNYLEAVPTLEEALHTFGGCGDRWAEAGTQLTLARALQHSGRTLQADSLLTRAAQAFDDLGDIRSRNAANQLRGRSDRPGQRTLPEETLKWLRHLTAGDREVDLDAAPRV